MSDRYLDRSRPVTVPVWWKGKGPRYMLIRWESGEWAGSDLLLSILPKEW